MENKNYRILTVQPNLIQVEVIDTDVLRASGDNFTIGGYLKISDEDDMAIVVVIQGYKIKEPKLLKSEEEEMEPASFILDTQPIGFLDAEGNFKRGGQQIAIPPSNVELADDELLKSIYSSVREEKRFAFSNLALNNDIEVGVDGDKFFGKHIAVVGSTGSGKSGTVARILQEGMKPSDEQNESGVLNNSHVILFDLHGEYGPAFPNAMKYDVDTLKLPYWLMNSEELEEMFIESNENNSHNQISQFRYAVIENKKKHNPDRSKLSYDTPVYFSLKEVLNYITNINNEMISGVDGDNRQPKLTDGTLIEHRTEHYFEDKLQFVPPSGRTNDKATSGPFNGDFDRFVMRLETKINDDRLDFLLAPVKEDNTEFKTDDLEDILSQYLGYVKESESNVTIVDLSGIPFEVLSIVVSLISRVVFDFCFEYKSHKADGIEVPFLLVLEEAHNYIPHSGGAKYNSVRKSIERIAKEGRKYGISLMIVSQRPSEISETIFSQCNNFVAMRLTNPSDQHYVRRLMPDSVGAITDTLPVLERQEALIIGDCLPMPTIVKVKDLEGDKPDSSDIDFRTEWQKDWVKVAMDRMAGRMRKEKPEIPEVEA